MHEEIQLIIGIMKQKMKAREGKKEKKDEDDDDDVCPFRKKHTKQGCFHRTAVLCLLYG
jgi:hypothetical protein